MQIMQCFRQPVLVQIERLLLEMGRATVLGRKGAKSRHGMCLWKSCMLCAIG